jgi:hypothetical protein
LTDLEEKLEVAQVQLEIFNTLAPHINDAPAVGERITALSTRLFTMSEVRCSVNCCFPASNCCQYSCFKTTRSPLTCRR